MEIRVNCLECGGNGVDYDGNPCQFCEVGEGKEQFDALENKLVIPSCYINNVLSAGLCENPNQGYQDILMKVARKDFKKELNLFITSRKGTSKKVAAYTVIQDEFRLGHKVIPVIDLLEAGSAMKALDYQKYDSGIDLFNPEDIMLVNYLFVEWGNEFSYIAYENFQKLINRRSRRGKGIVFLCNYSWDFLVDRDPLNIMENYNGDGSYETVKVYDYF